MENASKALLIAAAVMVAILVISLGMSIFNSNSDITDDASSTLESTAAFAFNQQFLSYMSESASGSSAKALVNKIINHNATVDASDPNTFSPGEHQIYLNFYPAKGTDLKHRWKTNKLKEIYDKILNGARYRIYVTNCKTHTGGYFNGYVICLSISELE